MEDDFLQQLSKITGNKKLYIPPTDEESTARVLDDELAKLGYGGTQRLSILGDAGRENNWKRNVIFKGHFDPKNKAFNRGIFSYQKDRGIKQDNFLKKQGVYGKGDDDELRGMARFMDNELKTDYPQVYQKLKNAKSTYEASEALREYIKYVPDAPYNTYDKDFRVKNNKVWAEKAKSYGLGVDRTEPSFLDNLKSITNSIEAQTPQSDFLSNIQKITGGTQPTNPNAAKLPIVEARKQLEQDLTPSQAAQVLQAQNAEILEPKRYSDLILKEPLPMPESRLEIGSKIETQPVTVVPPVETPVTKQPIQPRIPPKQAVVAKNATTQKGGYAEGGTAKQIAQAEREMRVIPQDAYKEVPKPETNLKAAQGKGILKSIAGSVAIDLSKKPVGFDTEEYLFRSALKGLSGKFGLTDEQIDNAVTLQRNTTGTLLKTQYEEERNEGIVTIHISRDLINAAKKGQFSDEIDETVQKDVDEEYAEARNRQILNNPVDQSFEIKEAEEKRYAENPLDKTNPTVRARIAEEMREASSFGYQEINDETIDAEIEKRQRQQLSPTEVERAESFTDSTFLGGLLGSGGRNVDWLAGLYKLANLPVETSLDFATGKTLQDPFQDEAAKISQAMRIIEEKSKEGKGFWGDVVSMGGGMVGDLPRLGLQMVLPGGAVAGFALDNAIQSVGRGDTSEQVFVNTIKGGVTGAIFKGAGVIGRAERQTLAKILTENELKALESGTLSVSKKAEIAPYIYGRGVTIGAITTGITAQGVVEGEELKDAFLNGLKLAVLDVVTNLKGDYKQLVGKIIKAKNAETGEEVGVFVDENGKIITTKEVPKEADIELDLNPEFRSSEGLSEQSKRAMKSRVDDAKTQAEPFNTAMADKMKSALGTVGKVALGKRNILPTKEGKEVETGEKEITKEDVYPTKQKQESAPVKSEVTIKAEESQKRRFNDAGVELLDIPLDKIRDENNWQAAKQSISEGYKPKSEGSVLAQVHSDGTYELFDGFHRAADALAKGEKTIEARLLPTGKSGKSLPETAKDVAPIGEKVKVITEVSDKPTKTVTTERGTKTDVAPKVIEAADLLTSLDEGYPAEYQPRDRSRQASKAQISEIANKLNAEFLDDSPKASDGRPLVVPVEINGKAKYAVISGNARSEAIRQAYKTDSTPSQKYAEFTQSKETNAKREPVYVGILDPNKVDLKTFAREANESTTAKMSATEQAKVDSDKLTNSLMNKFIPTEDGSIHLAANREFIRDFVKLLPETERNAVQQSSGELSQEGVNRIRNAILAKAYGESAVERIAESTDNNVKRITNALLQNAGKIAELKQNVIDGNRYEGLDISENLVKATEKFSFLRDEGMSVDEYLHQRGLFGETLNPFEKRILVEFDNYRNSTKAVNGILGNYLALANELGNPKQTKMFGEPVKPTSSALFERAVLEYKEGNVATTQTTLFDKDQRREADRSEAIPTSEKTVQKDNEQTESEVKESPKTSAFKIGDRVQDNRGRKGVINEKNGERFVTQVGSLNRIPLSDKWRKTPAQIKIDKQTARMEAKRAKLAAKGKTPINELDKDFEDSKSAGKTYDPIQEQSDAHYEALTANKNVRMVMSEAAQVGHEKGKVSSSDVIQSYEDVLKAVGKPTPIRTGRGNFAQKKAEGFYDTKQEIIRLRTANNIPTASHEIGHGFQKYVYGAVKASDLKSLPIPVKRELVKLGKDLYGDRKPNNGYGSEGFAEFMRLYLTTENVSREAPNTLKWFEKEILDKNPTVAKALSDARETTEVYRLQGAENRAKANTAKSGTVKDNIIRAKRALSQLPTQIIDEFTPLLRLSKDVSKITGKDLEPGADPFKVASFLRGNASATTHYFVFDGTMDFARNIVGEPLDAAASIVRGKKEAFSNYLIARRAQELLAEDINPGMTKEDADYLVQLYERPEFQLAAEKVHKWQDDVLNYAREASPNLAPIIDKIFAKNWKEHVPLMREFDDIDLRAIKRINQAGGNPLKRIRGSGRRIKDIFPQMIANAEKLIALANRQKVLDTIVNLSDVEGMGHIIEEVPVDKIPVSTEIAQIRKQLEDSGADLSKVDLDEVITFFSPAHQPKGLDPVVPMMKDGKMKWFQVDETLYNTLSGLDLYRLPKVLDLILGVPTRAFRLGTTGLRPAFSLITNPTRDIQTYYMQSKESNPAKLTANYFVALAQALNPKRLVGKSNKDLDLFYRFGANLAQPLGADIAITRRTAKELFQGKVLRKVMHPIEMARELLSVSESVPRVAEIRNIAKEIGWDGKSPLTFEQSVQMGLGAKQVTVDFSAAGSFGKKMNQAMPFFNANVQGTRLFAKQLRDRPARTALYGATALLMPTLLLWWKNKDEEWYKEMPSREKFMYWNIPSTDGKNIFQVPRAFEYGNVFSVIPETLADAWYTEDPQGAKDAFAYILDTSTPPVTPHTLQVAKEQWQNRIDFFDTPIVPKGEQDLLPGEQKSEGTSALASTLGEYFPNTISPRRFEHILRGLTGSVSIDVIRAVEQVTGIKPGKEKEMADVFAVGKLFRRGGTTGYGSKTIDKFYDEYERLTKLSRSDDKERKKEGALFGEAQKVSKALKELRELNLTDKSAESRNARTLLMREIAGKFLLVQTERKKVEANDRIKLLREQLDLAKKEKDVPKIKQISQELSDTVKQLKSQK